MGLNILPEEYKICSYNCVYCERGLTNVHTTNAANRNDELPSLEDFERALESALRQSQQVDALTFSGNGESTLHPQFEELVDIAMHLRDRYFPKAMVGILSNSSNIGIDKVIRGLVKLDYRMMKLDAGDTETFRIINRPSPRIEFQSLLERLKTFENITIQTMFIDGDPQNIGDQEIKAWIKCVGEILPDNVQIYSIHRPPAEPFVKEVSGDKLKQIASSVTTNTGVPVEVIVRDSSYRKRKRRYWK